ncbi:MAG: FAD-binding protein [bacterium]|nr:FAD-binding protein [bacterium]
MTTLIISATAVDGGARALAPGARVVRPTTPDSVPVEALAPALAEWVVGVLSDDDASSPSRIILPGRPAERALAGAIAARLAAPVFTSVTAMDGAEITVARYGGLVNETFRVDGTAVVVVDEGEETDGEAEGLELAADGAEIVSTDAGGSGEGNLREAQRVVVAGRGFTAKEDLSLARDLAAALDAEVGGTRPLAEGLGWLPKSAYVGISAHTIAPDLYLGVGVSGALHHLNGVDARVAAAIVDDEEAPIVEASDYVIVGNLYEVVPALIEELGKR